MTPSRTKRARSSLPVTSSVLLSALKDSPSKMTSLPAPLRKKQLMNSMPWSFVQRFQCISRKTKESRSRYYGRCSCRRRGERAELAPLPTEEQGSGYGQECRRSSYAACIKRVYVIDLLECPTCEAQMWIIAFIQALHSIKDIIAAPGPPEFRAPPPIPKLINAAEAIDEILSHDSFEPAPDDF